VITGGAGLALGEWNQSSGRSSDAESDGKTVSVAMKKSPLVAR